MISLLLLGFLLGMRHALEADHVAAVATLATRSRSVAESVRQGAAWGIGHTLTLFLFGSAVLLMDTVMPDRLAGALEAAVGLMLVALGGELLWRLWRQRTHLHVHRHADGTCHIHVHSHGADARPHDPERHEHPHPRPLPLRALLVGLMHGMAGSAALILLTLQTVPSPLTGLAYIGLFGVGSIAGMAALSFVIAMPLRYASLGGASWMHQGLQAVIAMLTIGLGAHIAARTMEVLI